MQIDPWVRSHADGAGDRMQKKVFGLTGLSNSGKTTLLEDLLAWFRQEGYSVSAIKHAHHGFDIDKPGKDSFRMREAGAEEVLLVGDERWVLMQEYRGKTEPALSELVARLAPCDVVLVEGFKDSNAPKIEVFRPSLSRPPLWPYYPSIVAVASDEVFACPVPVLNLNSAEQIGTFIRSALFACGANIHPE